MKKAFFKLALLSTVIALFSSCTKEGPAGPQGAQGPPGPQGNANVKTVVFANQSFTLNQLASVYQILETVPDLTSAVVQNGSVTAYLAKANNNNSDWTALPGNFTPDFTDMSKEHFFDFSYAVGSATIYTATNPGYNVDFKIVIVPGP